MRTVRVLVHGEEAGLLEELDHGRYRFVYKEQYANDPVSLTMPLINRSYEFEEFPSFLEGLLPEGMMLEGLLRQYKLDKNDFLGQITQVGHDLVGAITIEAIK